LRQAKLDLLRQTPQRSNVGHLLAEKLYDFHPVTMTKPKAGEMWIDAAHEGSDAVIRVRDRESVSIRCCCQRFLIFLSKENDRLHGHRVDLG